jgi:alpha-beta hydrolase superfamily lysophospholipase
MGATIAAAYAVRYQAKLAGLLVSGITLRAGADVPALMVAVARILSNLAPKLGVSVLDANAISKDKAVVDAYVSDPLVYRGKIRARLGPELMKVGAELSSTARDLKLPMLIMHGASDGLSGPESSRILYEQAGSGDKTLMLYEGLYHEIFNEPERETVFRDMEAWLKAHL